MKLVYIANVRIPTEKAHGIQIMKTCESFVSSGVEVEMVIPTRHNPEFKRVEPLKHYQIKNKFKVKKLWTIDPYQLIKLPQGIYIKFQTVFFIVSSFVYLLFKQDKMKNTFYTRDLYLLPLLHFFGLRVVWEGHDLPRRKGTYTAAIRKCFKIITITTGLKNEIVKLGIEEKNIFVSPDGVDFDSFANISQPKKNIKEKLELPVDKKLIVYSGHLYAWKGAEILAESSKFLGSDSLILFIGGTDHDIVNFKRKYDEYDRVMILGRKPHYQIPLYLKAADVLILPNSAKFEISKSFTSPIKLFEYMASNRPIIASDLPSLREIIDEDMAIFFEPDNPKDLADKITGLLKNEELGHKISANAFREIGQYTWKKRAEGILNFIKN